MLLAEAMAWIPTVSSGQNPEVPIGASKWEQRDSGGLLLRDKGKTKQELAHGFRILWLALLGESYRQKSTYFQNCTLSRGKARGIDVIPDVSSVQICAMMHRGHLLDVEGGLGNFANSAI